MKGSNPLHNIAANLGVTPKVLTQLATGEDREFRELVKGILSMLPEDEVILVAGDPEINPEFLEYLSHLFDGNQKILLTILQNPSSNRHTKQHILGRLPEDVLTAILKDPKLSPGIRQILTQPVAASGKTMTSNSQNEDFKIKMKVSKLLNDLEANMGVTIEAFLSIRSRNDEQSQEFVKEVYNELPEENVLIVARDMNTSPKILDYLSRLFDTNQKVLVTILANPSIERKTQQFVLERIPKQVALSLAENTSTPPQLLQVIGTHFASSEDIMVALLANPSTPMAVKEKLQELADSNEGREAPETVDLEMPMPSSEGRGTQVQPMGEIDSKITLCVDKLYDINADIVTDFMKQARAEILKRLELISNANRIILQTIIHHPELTIKELDHINMDMFVSLLKKLPNQKIDDQTILALMKKSKKKK